MISTVIFDFDGTIINTNALIEEGLHHFAYKYRGYRMTRDEIRSLTGKTLEAQMAWINEEKAELMTEQYRIWYAHNHNEKTSAFPGMLKLLSRLKQEGYTLAIVSNNSQQSLDLGLKHLGIADYFDQVITRDDVQTVKPSPEGLNHVLRTFGIRAENAIFIGDTGNDIEAAANAGIQSVMVSWTTMDAKTIMALDPDYILASPVQLHDILRNLSAPESRMNVIFEALEQVG
jgi:pyrophosphatase PpaX